MLTELDLAFTRQTGVTVEESFGHMGHVTAQAKEGGLTDIVFGDLDFFQSLPDLHVERFVDIGPGRLVVAWAKGVPMEKPSDLLRPEIDRIAVPDQRYATFGKAGMEFLKRSGMLDALRPRLIEVSTVPQVTAYLISGEVKAGLINVTDALGVGDKIGGFAEVDQSLYPPIRIVGALLPAAASKTEVVKYLEFLGSPAAKDILKKYGL
jgi:molybdate transport system substrate-binding protein